jgi:hypothetical protein
MSKRFPLIYFVIILFTRKFVDLCVILWVYVTNKMGSSLDDWIYCQLVTHSLIITLKYRPYSAISCLHNLQFTIAHTLEFSVSTGCLLAVDLYTQTVTVLNSNITCKSSPSQKHSSQLAPITHCKLVVNSPLRTSLNSLLQLTCVHWLVLNGWTAFSLSYKP